ncbi:hypothetical protein [[Eubacterium] cellulosolvens]
MAKKVDGEKKKESAPPTPALAFLVGLMLFTMVLSPAGVLFIFTTRLYVKLGLLLWHGMTLGCFLGVAIAIIPAIIFMRMAMKKIRK